MIFPQKSSCHHNNGTVHCSVVLATKEMEIRFQLVRDPPYYLDLAPSDNCSFPNLIKLLDKKKCLSNENVILETNVVVAKLDQFYFSEEINNLQQC